MNKPSISADEVRAYLKEHLDFFEAHTDLLEELTLPHNAGKAVSLVERQVSVLRDRNMDMRHRMSELLDNARENDRLFDKSKRLVLAMIEANDLGDLIDALLYSFDKEFGVQYTQVILFGNPNIIPQTAARVVSVNDARDYIGQRISGKRAVSGGLNPAETHYIFGDQANAIGSSAVASLHYGNPLGLLAVGNRDPDYYSSGMGTMFLSFIAEVLNRLLAKHL